jgi:hypothetical protein
MALLIGWTVGETASASLTGSRTTVNILAVSPLVTNMALGLVAVSQLKKCASLCRDAHCRLQADSQHFHRNAARYPAGSLTSINLLIGEAVTRFWQRKCALS